jgi:hypothetical protein
MSEAGKLAEWQFTDGITGKPDWDRIAAATSAPSHVAPNAERVRLILKGYADSYRQMDRDKESDGSVMAGSVYADFTNNIIPQVLEAIACAPSTIAPMPQDGKPMEMVAASRYMLQRIHNALLSGEFYQDYDEASKMTGWVRSMAEGTTLSAIRRSGDRRVGPETRRSGSDRRVTPSKEGDPTRRMLNRRGVNTGFRRADGGKA